MNALTTWFVTRNQREQRVLLAGTATVLLVLVLSLLLTLHRRVAAAEDRVSAKRQDLAWLQTVAPQVTALRPAATRGNESLVVLVDRVARATGLAQSLSGSQTSSDGGLRVRLEKAPFDAVVALLGQLSQQYGVAIASASIDSTGVAGTVNATLVLRQP